MSEYKYDEPWELEAKAYDTEGQPPLKPGQPEQVPLGAAVLKMGKLGGLTFTNIEEGIAIALHRATKCVNFCAGVKVPDKVGGLLELITSAREMEIWSDFVKGDPPASNALKELREALKPFDYMIDEKGGEA